MTASVSRGRPIRLVIRQLGIRAGSAIEARRLADAIGPAIERALQREAGIEPTTEPASRSRRHRPADHAAAAIVDAVALRLKDAAR